MILSHFPKHENSSSGETDFSCFHRENVVVCARASEISYSEHTAPLSIKSCLKGKEIYELRNTPIAVEENKYLVINNKEEYASYILSNEVVESFCIFFQDNIEQQTLAVFEHSHETLLEDPYGESYSTTPLFQNLRYQNLMISSLLSKIKKELDKKELSQLRLDEYCNELIAVLLKEQVETLKEIQKLPMARQSTRLEIYRRVSLAKDYMGSCFDEKIDLKILAKIACLSEHHFLRLFKSVFQQTPHQYLTNVRLQRALKLLKEQKTSITDICFSVGFENPSSFARLFKSRFKVSPQEVR